MQPIFIAGPCVIESATLLNTFAHELVRINRTSIHSFRGPGLDKGLQMLADIKAEYGLQILTDIHESCQAEAAGEVCDVLQIPAFLCRQTDLLVSAAKTGKTINIKKAQFLSGADMRYPVEKAMESGAKEVWLTERGNSFGYNNLVVDFRNGKTSGDRRFVPSMALAAKAFGATGYFFEVHPNPDKGLSDGPNMLELDKLEQLIAQLL